MPDDDAEAGSSGCCVAWSPVKLAPSSSDQAARRDATATTKAAPGVHVRGGKENARLCTRRPTRRPHRWGSALHSSRGAPLRRQHRAFATEGPLVTAAATDVPADVGPIPPVGTVNGDGLRLAGSRADIPVAAPVLRAGLRVYGLAGVGRDTSPSGFPGCRGCVALGPWMTTASEAKLIDAKNLSTASRLSSRQRTLMPK
jgi:hypothetical protein